MPDEKERHEKLHQPVGTVYEFRGQAEWSPLSKQPLCEVCGQPRGTPMPKDEPRVVIGPRVMADTTPRK